MWCLADVHVLPSQTKLWFSDGKPVDAIRGGFGVSSRLIVEGQGFLDLTVVQVIGKEWIDANGSTLWPQDGPEHEFPFNPSHSHDSPWLLLFLSIESGSFAISMIAIPAKHSRKGITASILRSACSGSFERRFLYSLANRVRKAQAVAYNFPRRCHVHR